MPSCLAALVLVLVIGTVLARAFALKRHGIIAMRFAGTDKTDLLILPFAFLYVYIVLAAAFDWPRPQRLLVPGAVAWMGVGLCVVGLALMWWSIVSFGRSFRVGVDTTNPDRLVTTGIFAFSRNPIYVAFAGILLGDALVVANWVVVLYFFAGIALFHRQVLREERFLKVHYGSDYVDYCRQVRRYV